MECPFNTSIMRATYSFTMINYFLILHMQDLGDIKI